MNERIKQLRNALNLKQDEFGKKIKVAKTTVSTMEIGKRNITDRNILTICETFNVNETWLRTGEGQMFIEKQKSLLLDELKEEYKLSENELRMLEGYLAMSEGDRKQFVDAIHNMVKHADETEEAKPERKTIIKKVSTQQKTVSIPIYTPTAAGFGHYADNEIIGYEKVPAEWIDDSEDYCIVRVDGDSMSPKFEDNNLLLVKRQDSVDSGTIAVVLVDNESSFIKKVVYDKEWIELVSINPEYPPIRFEGKDILRVRVFGTVERCIDKNE